MPLFVINKIAVKKPDGSIVGDLYFQIPLLDGQKAEDVDLKEVNPHSLIPCSGPEDAHVVRWMFGGDFKVSRIGGKRTIAPGEVAFLQGKGLGSLLINVAAEEGDDIDAEATRTILTQNAKLSNELEAARAEALRIRTENQQVKNALEATQRRVVELDIKLKQADAKGVDLKAYDEAVAENALLNDKIGDVNKDLQKALNEKQAMTNQIADLKDKLKKASKAAPPAPPAEDAPAPAEPPKG